jgi:hypothetical protein
MSKTFKTGLTGSRKTRRRPGVDLLDWQDEMTGHCRRLETLAEVLNVACPALEPPVIAGIGDLVGQEIKAIRGLLEKLEGLR